MKLELAFRDQFLSSPVQILRFFFFFTRRLTWVRLQQPQEQCYPVLQVHAGSFHVSVIHQTLTRTTGSLTCAREHSCVCVHTRELGTPTSEWRQHFWLGKTHRVCCTHTDMIKNSHSHGRETLRCPNRASTVSLYHKAVAHGTKAKSTC